MKRIDIYKHQEFVYGVACVEKCGDGLMLKRMTPDLLNFYSNNEYEDIRANCSAGVRICFISDTSRIGMSIKTGRTAREIFSTDIMVDEAERLSFFPENGEKSYSFNFEAKDSGFHRYEIFMPNLCESELLSLTVDDDASVLPAEYSAGTLIFIGDSITQGMTVSGPSRSYAAMLAGMCRSNWTNISIGGAVMKGELGVMAQAYEWQRAVVAYGCNDFCSGRDLDEFAEDTREMLRNLSRRDGCRIFVITPIVLLQDFSASAKYTLEEYREHIFFVGREFSNVTVIDGKKLIPADEKFFVDGCHPNDEGMQLMAEALHKYIF